MRSSLKYFLGMVAIAVLVSPLWARTDEMTLTVDHAITIGTTKVQAGEYQVKADEDKTTIQVLQNGTVVATAQGSWSRLPKKAEYSTATYDADHLVTVQFEGRAESFNVK